jgi:hypothetical protein
MQTIFVSEGYQKVTQLINHGGGSLFIEKSEGVVFDGTIGSFTYSKIWALALEEIKKDLEKTYSDEPNVSFGEPYEYEYGFIIEVCVNNEDVSETNLIENQINMDSNGELMYIGLAIKELYAVDLTGNGDCVSMQEYDNGIWVINDSLLGNHVHFTDDIFTTIECYIDSEVCDERKEKFSEIIESINESINGNKWSYDKETKTLQFSNGNQIDNLQIINLRGNLSPEDVKVDMLKNLSYNEEYEWDKEQIEEFYEFLIDS